MPEQLRDKVVGGVAWNVTEKVGSMLLQLVVSIVVARLLSPEDYGVMAILTFFSALALVIVDSGFSQMLIRKKEPTDADYKAVFVFNIIASIILYLVLVSSAPFIADFYDIPMLKRIAPVLFLLVPINSLCVIQNTIFTRQFRFALLSKVILLSSLISGAVAIAMALLGFGIWSLVAQRVLVVVVKAVMLWWESDWRPRVAYTSRPLREMASYSLSLLATDLISAIYNRISQLFIGKMYSTDVLGFFDQAQKLKDQPVTSAMQAVQTVTFPALAKIGDDSRKFAESYRQVIMVVTFVMFPIMVGLIAVADDMFALFLGEKWMPTVPYFRVLCLSGLFVPVATIAYNVLKVKSNGRIIVRLEIAKKVVMTLILAITIPHSVISVTWGLVGVAAFEMIVNVAAARRYTTLSAFRLLRTLLPVIGVTAAMWLSVYLIELYAVTLSLSIILGLKIMVGGVSYIIFSWLFRLEALREMRSIIAGIGR